MFHQLLAPDAGRQSSREGSLDRRAERCRARLSGTRKWLAQLCAVYNILSFDVANVLLEEAAAR
jgi:hypothetical protein